MYKLYFLNSAGERRVLAEVADEKEMWKELFKFLEDHDYKSYYQRLCGAGDEMMIDVGSWSEFFYIDKKNIRKGIRQII